MPLVSVVMPVFDQERYVTEAIKSVLAQTFHDFEFIIVNNGSTDRTAELIDEFDDPRIRVFCLEQRGFLRSIEHGIKQANGKWIARMDSDDITHPDRLRRQLEFLEQRPECIFLGSVYGIVTPNDRYLLPVTNFDWRYIAPRDITVKSERFADPSAIFDRERAVSVGLYDPDFENEKPLYYKLLRQGRGAVLSDPLHFVRWRLGSVSRSNFEKWFAVNRDVRLRYDPDEADLNVVYHFRGLEAAEIGALDRCVYYYQLAGDHAAARETAVRAWSDRPFNPKLVKIVAKALLCKSSFRTWTINDPYFVRADPKHVSEDRRLTVEKGAV